MTNARSTATDGRAPRPNQANATEAGAPRGPGSKTPKQGKTMKGAEAVVASLEAEGVDLVFGYPGGQAIKSHDALYGSDRSNVLACLFGPCTRPTATRAPRATWAWSSSPAARAPRTR
ncbi:MAG: thiamine pyrophosphate-binding protein [Eggerthella lenta]